MVFAGGGMEIPMFLGMYEGAVEAGKKPDVITATCGGSIAATIASSFNTTQEMKDFLRSSEFFDFFNSVRMERMVPDFLEWSSYSKKSEKGNPAKIARSKIITY